MRPGFLFCSVMLLLMFQNALYAQTTPVNQPTPLPKIELGGEFTTITLDSSPTRAEAGFGARVTYNVTKNLALESVTFFFPRRTSEGRITEVLGGVKAGKRFKSWGIFAKARPGFVNFSDGQEEVLQLPSNPTFPFTFRRSSLASFATDLGGVLEFYPSKRVITRFDFGDTIIHYQDRTRSYIYFDPLINSLRVQPFTIPSTTTHNFQFSASVGIRFW